MTISLREVYDLATENHFRINAVDAWKEEQMEPRLRAVEADVQTLSSKDAIADAVADRIHKRDRFQFTLLQTVCGFVVGAVILAAAVLDIASKVQHP